MNCTGKWLFQEIRMLILAKANISSLSGTQETKCSESELNLWWMLIVYQWIFFFIPYFIESLNSSVRKVISLFHWWGNWGSKRLSDPPKFTQLVSKVVWRPNRQTGNHSLHFAVKRPFHDPEEWWGWKAAWEMNWTAVAYVLEDPGWERKSCRAQVGNLGCKGKVKVEGLDDTVGLLQKGKWAGEEWAERQMVERSEQGDGSTSPSTLQPLHLVQCPAHRKCS